MNCPHCGRDICIGSGRDICVGSVWSAERERLAREYERNFYDSQRNFFASVLPLRVWRADVPGWFEPQSEWEKIP